MLGTHLASFHLDTTEHLSASSPTWQGQPKQIWFPEDLLGPRFLNEICLTKASANVTMVQFFFWKLTRLTDQLHSTGEIKGCREGRSFTTLIHKPKITSQKNTQQTGEREQRKLLELCLVFISVQK